MKKEFGNNGDNNSQQQGSCKTYLKNIIYYNNDCAFEIKTINKEEYSSNTKQSSHIVDHNQDSIDTDHGNNYNHGNYDCSQLNEDGLNNNIDDYCNVIDSAAVAENHEVINLDTTAAAATAVMMLMMVVVRRP